MRRGSSPARRALAAIGAAWLVAFVVLGARHEARTAHVVDGHGQVHHAQLDRAHTGTESDVHSATGDTDTDLCPLEAALHQAARHEHARAAAPVAPAIATVSIPAERPTLSAGLRVFRIAPKTSPPRA